MKKRTVIMFTYELTEKEVKKLARKETALTMLEYLVSKPIYDFEILVETKTPVPPDATLH